MAERDLILRNAATMTRTHLVRAVSNVVSLCLLTVFTLMFLALIFGCQAPPSMQSGNSVQRPGNSVQRLGNSLQRLRPQSMNSTAPETPGTSSTLTLR